MGLSYEEAGTSPDIDDLVQYCIDGAVENNEINNVTLETWSGGSHIADTYLDHNTTLNREEWNEVRNRVHAWWEAQKGK